MGIGHLGLYVQAPKARAVTQDLHWEAGAELLEDPGADGRGGEG